MAKWTRKKCFDHYGVDYGNERWSWSGRSADGSVVAMTFWQGELSVKDGRFSYASRPRREEKRRPGGTERLRNLQWARDHCDGIVRVVMAIAKDPSADTREAKSWTVRDDLLMRVTSIDESTGAFTAEGPA